MRTIPAPTLSLRHHFADLTDPRSEHTKHHSLLDLIGLTLCAVIAGADTWTQIASYGRAKLDWLSTFLDLPHGIPSHDTLGRVFAALDPVAFQDCFLAWMQAVVQASRGKLIALDGKTLRHSFDTAEGKSALHLVSAWACDNHLLLGQHAVADKSNEITAFPELLKLLDLQGALVTIDAMGCQKTLTEQITRQGGHYVLALKDNQPTLHHDVQQLFWDGLGNDFTDLEHRGQRTSGKGHGRTETRHYHLVKVPPALAQKHVAFQGLQTVGMVFSERQVGKAETTAETRYYISSLDLDVKAFAEAVRSHWSIENNLHWVLDTTFLEDASGVRKDHGPENLGLFRRIALSLLEQTTTRKKQSMADKRKTAGWNNQFLQQVLLGRSAP
jgi:predicted transposase YbfD/YdcC